MPAPRRHVDALGEDALIQRLQRRFANVASAAPPRWSLGIGDDAALWRPSAGHELVVTTDLAVEGQDFVRPRVAPRAVGWRALAQNLSDLAAMGARPVGWLLGLALPRQLELAWLDGAIGGMAALAAQSACPLVGGDLSATDGPITLAITALGEVPAGRALTRAGAAPGDALWVSGTPGLAGRGLTAVLGPQRARADAAARRAFLQPQPRLALGQALRGRARACIDLSDGLLRDLGRLASASAVAAHLETAALPGGRGLTLEQALLGGEEFELLFAAPPGQAPALRRLARRLALPLTRIGHLAAGRGVRVDGRPWRGGDGFDHFARSTGGRAQGD